MDVLLMAGVHQQPDQSSYLAEGQTCKLLFAPQWLTIGPV